jgi:hypothetical protein
MRKEFVGCVCSVCRREWGATDFERLAIFEREETYDGEAGTMTISVIRCKFCCGDSEKATTFTPYPPKVEVEFALEHDWIAYGNPINRN